MPKFASREEYEAWKTGRTGDTPGPTPAVPEQSQTRESLITDAQAQITWGHDPKRVEMKLVQGGLSPDEAREVIGEVQGGINAAVRGRAILEMLGGVIVLFVSLLIIQYIEANADRIHLIWYFLPFLGGFAALLGLHRMITGSRVGMEMTDE